jgi:Mannosyltransferase (PIG-V)
MVKAAPAPPTADRRTVVEIPTRADAPTRTDTATRVELPTPVEAPARDTRWVWRVLRTYGLSRLLVLATALVATTGTDPGAGPWPVIPRPHLALLRALARWDGAWYIDIAQHGYHHVKIPPGGDASYAFFPFYPWLIRAGSWITTASPLVVALVLATVLGGVGAVLIRILTAQAFDERVADRAATLFCFFPGAFVLSMAYTEALTIAAVAASILALTKRRWVLAGVLGAVAAMTRPTGAVLILAAGWCAVAAWRRGEGRRPFYAPALTAAGLAVVVVGQWVQTGHPLEWLHVEHVTWHDHSGFTIGIFQRLSDFVHSGTLGFGTGDLNDPVWAGGFLIALVGAWLLVRRRLPAVLTIYGLGALLFAASSFNVGPRPRPLLAAFPVVIAIAASVSGWKWRVVLVASTLGLIAMSLLTFLTLSAVP